MKFAISNIAWAHGTESEVLPFLREQGITGIEIAPTMVWPNWEGLNVTSAGAYAETLREQGFVIPAMQAIFFGKHCGSIFQKTDHAGILEHFEFIADIAAAMGASCVVFGSPGMRTRKDLPMDAARECALPLLRQAADKFHQRGLHLCMEACSAAYSCDFINTHSELLGLITEVGHPGFGLHIDSSNLYETDEKLTDILAKGLKLRHYHISEPNLCGFQAPKAPHADNLAQLKAHRYQGWVSIEMRKNSQPLQQAGPWRYLANQHAH